jgi:hypothetical protein
MTRETLREMALKALAGVGDSDLGEWEEWNDRAGVFHLRRRLSVDEQAQIGEAIDIRGTPEEAKRRSAVRPFLPPYLRERIDELG